MLPFRQITYWTKKQNWYIFFSLRVFFHRHWQLTGSGSEGNIFYSTLPLPPTHGHSDSYFTPLHMRWLSNISNRTACIYQTATRWDLPPYRITIWLIHDVMLIFVCLLVDLIQGFFLQLFDTGNQWTRTCIYYYPCITSEPTNQVR